jgi:N-acetyl-gamma-glutamyl-phosphate reductase
MASKTIGIVGARGHTGAELIRLAANHPSLELAFVSSRELDGQKLADHNEAYTGSLAFTNLDAAAVAAQGVDVVILALPNGKAAPYVEAIDKAGGSTVVIDLSADYRFDERWYYGLPELYRDRWRGEKRISNPGCYATAIQTSIAPIKDLLAAPPVSFGVSVPRSCATISCRIPSRVTRTRKKPAVTSVSRWNSCRMSRRISAA